MCYVVKMSLDEIISKIKEYGGKVFFQKEDISALPNNEYIDWRHNTIEEWKKYCVYPAVLYGRSIYYVCPTCCRLHIVDKDDFKPYRTLICGCADNCKRSRKRTMFPDSFGCIDGIVPIYKPILVDAVKIYK